MAAIIFKRLRNQGNGRRRYAVRVDTSGNALERKPQMTTEQVMTPKYIVYPSFMPAGADRNAPYVKSGKAV